MGIDHRTRVLQVPVVEEGIMNLGPNGDLFTPLFLASLGSMALTGIFFILGLIVFAKKNEFWQKQNAKRRMASTKPVVVEDDQLASDVLTALKKGIALMKGIWTGLDPTIGLFFRTQIPSMFFASVSLCTMSGAIFDLLWH